MEKKNKVVKRRRPNFGIAPLSQIILASTINTPFDHHQDQIHGAGFNGANPWIASGEVWWVICRNCDFDSSGFELLLLYTWNQQSTNWNTVICYRGLYAQYWLNHSTLLICVDCILIFVHKTNNPCRLNSLSLLKHPLLCLKSLFLLQ